MSFVVVVVAVVVVAVVVAILGWSYQQKLKKRFHECYITMYPRFTHFTGKRVRQESKPLNPLQDVPSQHDFQKIRRLPRSQSYTTTDYLIAHQDSPGCAIRH